MNLSNIVKRTTPSTTILLQFHFSFLYIVPHKFCHAAATVLTFHLYRKKYLLRIKAALK